MHFELATAARIVFGAGTFQQAGRWAAELAAPLQRPEVLVISGCAARHTQTLLELLEAEHLSCSLLNVASEPTIALVQEATQLARSKGCRLVVGLGGGSAVDAGKAVAAMITNPGDLPDYLEVIGKNRPLTEPPAPYIAIPTTAGTGAEVTRNAVLTDPQQQVKVSLRSPLLLPRLALVDPELTYDLPPDITAGTGLDALTQLIEAFVCVRANPLTDALCREGIGRAARSLPRVYRDGRDAPARQDMALASLFSGIALANAGLGAAHGLAAPIGGMFTAPHGAVCAALIPHVMAVNVQALRRRDPQHGTLARYAEIGRLLTGDPTAGAEDAVRWVQRLGRQLAIPGLRSYGLSEKDLPALVEKARSASSMKGNPIALDPEELLDVLSHAL